MAINLTGNTIASTYNQLLHVDAGPAATEKTIYSGVGVATALKVGTLSASVDNIRLDGNTISTLDTNGDLALAPNGTGSVTATKVAITGGTITGITDLAVADGGTGASTAAGARTNLGLGTMAVQDAGSVSITGGAISNVTFTGSFSGMTLVSATTITGVTTTNGGNLRLTGNTVSSTNTNGDINLTPDGTGKVVTSTADINGGAIDGTPIGVAAAAAVKGTTVEATTSIGYPAGTGGTVTQLTSKATGVTLNKICGQITMHNDALAHNASVSFAFTNSFIAATDVLIFNISGGATAGAYDVNTDAVAAGLCNISLFNHSGGSLAEAVRLNFAIIKAVNA